MADFVHQGIADFGFILFRRNIDSPEQVRALTAELRDCIGDASLDRVLLFFPDPWHKARHNKRRIVRPEFAQLVRQKLKVGGILHMATDWQPYAEYMLEIMQAAPGYRNLAADGGCVERPAERPVTKFERRGERLGHGVWDIKFQRVD